MFTSRPRSTSQPLDAHLLILAGGILLGVLLGPASLGRLSPAWYDQLVLGAGPQQQFVAQVSDARQAYLAETQAVQATLANPSLKEEARTQLSEQLADRQIQQVILDRQFALATARLEQTRKESTNRWTGWILALALVTAVVMGAEAAIRGTGQSGRLASRLVTVRYAAAGAALGCAMIQPAVMRSLPWPFAAMALVVAAAAILFPWPRSKRVSP